MNAKAERLGILGGTFNPVHNGHLIAARSAKERLDLDRLLLLPNTRSPLRLQEELADPRRRLEMVRLAVEDEPGLEACDLEVRREGTSFLVDTLAELHTLHPAADLVFLMGVDSLDTFDRWREVLRITELARVVVIPRPGDDATAALRAMEARKPELRGRIRLLEAGPQLDISATEIRERVRAGRSVRWLLPEKVAAYIREQGLYLN